MLETLETAEGMNHLPGRDFNYLSSECENIYYRGSLPKLHDPVSWLQVTVERQALVLNLVTPVLPKTSTFWTGLKVMTTS